MTAYEEFLCVQEIKKVEQELEVYKKALGLAISDIRTFCNSTNCKLCPLDASCEFSNNGDWEADYLQKAREEE